MTTTVQRSSIASAVEGTLEQDTISMTPEFEKICKIYQQNLAKIEVLTTEIENEKSQLDHSLKTYRTLYNTENPILFVIGCIYYALYSPVSTYQAYQIGKDEDYLTNLEKNIADKELQLQWIQANVELQLQWIQANVSFFEDCPNEPWEKDF